MEIQQSEGDLEFNKSFIKNHFEEFVDKKIQQLPTPIFQKIFWIMMKMVDQLLTLNPQ